MSNPKFMIFFFCQKVHFVNFSIHWFERVARNPPYNSKGKKNLLVDHILAKKKLILVSTVPFDKRSSIEVL